MKFWGLLIVWYINTQAVWLVEPDSEDFIHGRLLDLRGVAASGSGIDGSGGSEAPTTTSHTTEAPTTTPAPTVAQTTTPPTTMAATTTPASTVAQTATPPTTVAATTTPASTVAPTTTPPTKVAATTTVAPTTISPSTLAPTTTELTCPDGFGYTLDTGVNASCYKFIVVAQRTWSNARDHCMSLGGDLVGIETEEEMDHLTSVVKNEPSLQGQWFWSAGTDEDVEGDWKWASTGAWVNSSLPDAYSVREENTLNCLAVNWEATYSEWDCGECTYDTYSICEAPLG